MTFPNWITSTYYWLWHDFIGMEYPFTYYFRILASKKPLQFWLPVAFLAAFAVGCFVALIVVLVSLIRLRGHSNSFWRIVGVTFTVIFIAAALILVLFFTWFILHIAQVQPFGSIR